MTSPEQVVAMKRAAATELAAATEHGAATVALTVSYNGAPFSGYAKQPGQLTVQGQIEEALALVFRHPVDTTCAGRTDSGVHALGQVVSFQVPDDQVRDRSLERLAGSLTALTHDDVVVRSAELKPEGFSARFSAVSREYRYFICVDRPAPLLMRDFCWHVSRPLDAEAMRAGAAHLIGEHDFKSFCMAASAEGKPTHRHVAAIEVEPVEAWGSHFLCVRVVGNAFLHSMVRTIVGTLVLVGKGKRAPEWVAQVLAARDRSAAGETAPAQGLVLWGVDYDGPRLYEPDVT